MAHWFQWSWLWSPLPKCSNVLTPLLCILLKRHHWFITDVWEEKKGFINPLNFSLTTWWKLVIFKYNSTKRCNTDFVSCVLHIFFIFSRVIIYKEHLREHLKCDGYIFNSGRLHGKIQKTPPPHTHTHTCTIVIFSECLSYSGIPVSFPGNTHLFLV